jgi:tetratricopeptide (TPR) repeat protein
MRIAGMLRLATSMLALLCGAASSPAAAVDPACRAQPTGACVVTAADEVTQTLSWRSTGRIFDKLAVAHARLGHLDRAVATTRRSNNPSEGQLQVALALAQAERFDDALRIARRILEPETKVRALGLIARQATKAGQAALAGRVGEEARQVADAPDYAVAVLLAQFGQLDEALALANATRGPLERADLLTLMVYLLIEDGQVEAALRVAHLLADRDAAPYALAGVAGGLARAGQDDRADRLFDEAGQAADRTRDDPPAGSSRLRAQVFVAKAMAEARRFTRAEALAGRIGDRGERSVVLAEIGTHYAQAGQRAPALRLFRQAAATAPRPRDLSLVLDMIARAGEIEEAQRLAATLDPANAVSDPTAAGIFQAGVTFAAAQGRFEEARRYIDAIPAAFPDVRSAARVALITALAQAGVRDRRMALVSQALELAAMELPAGGYRVQALIEIAHALVMAGL